MFGVSYSMCAAKGTLVAAVCLMLLTQAEPASFLKRLEQKSIKEVSKREIPSQKPLGNLDPARQKRHSLFGLENAYVIQVDGKNYTILDSSMSLSLSASGEVANYTNGMYTAQRPAFGEEDEAERSKRHALTPNLEALLSRAIKITVDGKNYTVLGSSLFSSSASNELFLGTHPLLGSRIKIHPPQKGRRRRATDFEGHSGPLEDFRERPKRHGLHIEQVPIAVGYNNTLGTNFLAMSESIGASSSLDSGMVVVPVATTATTTKQPLSGQCCEKTTCISFQKIYDSCTKANLTHDKCMKSLQTICDKFKKSVTG